MAGCRLFYFSSSLEAWCWNYLDFVGCRCQLSAFSDSEKDAKPWKTFISFAVWSWDAIVPCTIHFLCGDRPNSFVVLLEWDKLSNRDSWACNSVSGRLSVMVTGVPAPSYTKPGHGGSCCRICLWYSMVFALAFTCAGGIRCFTVGPGCGHPRIMCILCWLCHLHDTSLAQGWVIVLHSCKPAMGDWLIGITNQLVAYCFAGSPGLSIITLETILKAAYESWWFRSPREQKFISNI